MHSLWSDIAAVDTSRATDLLARVQGEFDEFVRSLPPDQKALARDSATFDGLPDGVYDWRLTDLTPALTGLPWLFWDLFHPAPDELFIQLALASVYLSLASIITDHLVDEQVDNSEDIVQLRERIYRKGINLFEDIFPEGSPFRIFFQFQEEIHRTAWALEKSVQQDPDQYTAANFQAIGEGKGAPPLLTVSAFAELIGFQTQLPALNKSITAAVKASLLGDDLQDWPEDLAAQRWTYFLARLSAEGGWPEKGWPDPQACKAIVDRTWIDVQGWRETIAFLEQAMMAVKAIPCTTWRKFLEKHRKVAEESARLALAGHLKKMMQDEKGLQERG